MEQNIHYKSKHDPLFQIELLRRKSKKISPSLYKLEALYLEILRDCLLEGIKTSLFYLLTENCKNKSKLPPIEIRNKFQLQVEKIVSDNASFLTVEHLINLAESMYQEKQNQLNNAKEEIFNSLTKTERASVDNDYSFYESVELSMTPPLDQSSIVEGWSGEIETPCTFISHDAPEDNALVSSNPNDDKAQALNENLIEPPIGNSLDSLDNYKSGIDIFQSFFVLAEDSDNSEANGAITEENISKVYVDSDKGRSESFLPESPLGLLEWVESLEMALTRRLRNLSHSINIELLRHGFVNTLIPLSLLDSLVDGHLPSNSPVSNIAALKLPVNVGLASDGIDIDCVLLRQSDLEFDYPRLRKCKLHIKHYRSEILRMVKQQRYWQGRSLADELRQDWWQSPPKTKKENLIK